MRYAATRSLADSARLHSRSRLAVTLGLDPRGGVRDALNLSGLKRAGRFDPQVEPEDDGGRQAP
jgi:hypothetical protein